MVERFDIEEACPNTTTAKFREEHLSRYAFAAEFCRSIDRGSALVVIDAACGTGYGYKHLSGFGEYLGLDVSEDALAISRQRNPGAQFARADFNEDHALDRFGDADVIVSFETVEHLRNPETFFASCHRSLDRRRGHLIFSAPTCLSRDFDRFHLHDRSADEWRRSVEAMGFTVLQEQGTGFETTFVDSAKFPSPIKEKIRLAAFIMVHPVYLRDRFVNWIIKNRFVWQSHLFVCRVAPRR